MIHSLHVSVSRAEKERQNKGVRFLQECLLFKAQSTQWQLLFALIMGQTNIIVSKVCTFDTCMFRRSIAGTLKSLMNVLNFGS